MATGLCPDCGSNLDLVGIRHRCLKRTTDDSARENSNGPVSQTQSEPKKGHGKISKGRSETTKPLATKRAKSDKADNPPSPKTGNGTIKRGPPFKGQENQTLTALKPWEKEGISRRSWYRKRQQEAKQ